MRRLHRVVLAAALIALAPALAGCENFDWDKLDFLHLNQKKPLPGKRVLLFPNGVPGVSQGIPKQYTEQYQKQQQQQQQQNDAALTPLPGQTANPPAAAPVRATGKPQQITVTETPPAKPAPKKTAKRKIEHRHKRTAKRKTKPKPKQTAAKPAPSSASAWPTSSQQQQKAAPWSSSSQTETSSWPSANQTTDSPWPSAPPSGTFSK
jgi:hypothetical protein